MPELANYASWGPRYPRGYTGGQGQKMGGRMIGWNKYSEPLFAAKLRWWELENTPRTGGRLSDLRRFGRGMYDFYREKQHRGFLRRDITEVARIGRSRAGAALQDLSSGVASRARSAYGFMNLAPGGGLRALGAETLGYATPMALGAGLGAGVGVTAALGAGDVAGLGSAAAAGAAIGAGGGFLAWNRGASLLKLAGRAGLSTAGMVGGGLEVLFGMGSRTATRGAELLATGGIRGSSTVLSRLGAGGVAGAVIGGMAGGTGGGALIGAAMGAGFGMSLRKMGTGALGGLTARHPIAALTLGTVGLAALRGGRRVAEQALSQDHPSFVAPGSWSEVYGLPSNHMNTAGVGLAAHYRRR